MLILQRILKLSLVVAFVAGVVMFGLAKRAQEPIKEEYDRLTAKFGEMPAASPDHFQIIRLPTAEPWQIDWRLRKPENRDMVVESYIAFGGGSSSGRATISSGGQLESMVRFRVDFDGSQMRCFLKRPGGSSSSGSGDRKTAEAFHDHWDELDVKTAPPEGFASFGPDQVIELVRITAPEKFSDGTPIRSGKDGVCLLVRIGTQQAFDNEEPAAGDK